MVITCIKVVVSSYSGFYDNAVLLKVCSTTNFAIAKSLSSYFCAIVVLA